MRETRNILRAVASVGLLDEISERLTMIDRERGRLDEESRSLKAKRAEVRKLVLPDKNRTSVRQAGATNIAKVAAALRSAGGRATQSRLTELTGLNSGTMTYALRALAESGAVKPTGTLVRRSPEFVATGEAYVMPPGSGQS